MPLALAAPSPARFLLSLAIAVACALIVFRHASTHGSRRATAWGIAAFLAAIVVVPVYFVRYWLSTQRR